MPSVVRAILGRRLAGTGVNREGILGIGIGTALVPVRVMPGLFCMI